MRGFPRFLSLWQSVKSKISVSWILENSAEEEFLLGSRRQQLFSLAFSLVGFSQDIRLFLMEENGQKSNLGTSSAADAVVENHSTTVSYQQAKERLQRFDLVIQHLHRLRATLALDSSVRELQKLQTLNILGQSLMQPNSRHTHNAAAGPHPPMPLLPPIPHPPPPPQLPGGMPTNPNFLHLRPPMPPHQRMPEPFFHPTTNGSSEKPLIQPLKPR